MVYICEELLMHFNVFFNVFLLCIVCVFPADSQAFNHKGDLLPRSDRQRKVVDHRGLLFGVVEGNMFEFDVPCKT